MRKRESDKRCGVKSRKAQSELSFERRLRIGCLRNLSIRSRGKHLRRYENFSRQRQNYLQQPSDRVRENTSTHRVMSFDIATRELPNFLIPLPLLLSALQAMPVCCNSLEMKCKVVPYFGLHEELIICELCSAIKLHRHWFTILCESFVLFIVWLFLWNQCHGIGAVVYSLLLDSCLFQIFFIFIHFIN